MNKILIVFAGLLLAGCGDTKYTLINQSTVPITAGDETVGGGACVVLDEGDFPLEITGEGRTPEKHNDPANLIVSATGVTENTSPHKNEDDEVVCPESDGTGAAADGHTDETAPTTKEECDKDATKEWVNNKCLVKCGEGQTRDQADACVAGTAGTAVAPPTSPQFQCSWSISTSNTTITRSKMVSAENEAEAKEKVINSEGEVDTTTILTCAQQPSS